MLRFIRPAPDPTDSLANRVDWVLTAARHVGFHNLLDVFTAQLELYVDTRPVSTREVGSMRGRDKWYSFDTLDETRELFTGERIGNLVCTVFKHPFFHLKTSQTSMLRYRPLCEATVEFTSWVLKEEVPLITSVLRKPVNEYTFADVVNFSVEKDIIRPLKEDVPFTYRLLLAVFAPKEWLSDYGKKGDPWAPEPPWEEPERNSRNSKKDKSVIRKTASLNKRFIVCLALAVLGYTENQLSNKLQGFIGYFCAASSVPKRVVATLNKMAVCISYDSIINIQKSVAQDVAALIHRLIVIEGRRFQISFDNQQITASTKFQMKHKVSHMQNNVLAYLLITDEIGQIPRTDINRAAINSVKPADLMPPDSTMESMEDAAVYLMFKQLTKLCDKEIKNWKKRNPDHVPCLTAVHSIPTEGIRERQQLFSLPLMHLNETKLEDVVKILETLAKVIGFDPKKLNEYIILLKGDQLTVQRVISAMFLRQDAHSFENTFAYLEPIIGLFHLEMDITKLLINVFWGNKMAQKPEEDLALDTEAQASQGYRQPGTLSNFTKLVGNTRVKREQPDFRANQHFLESVTDGHIMALVFTELGVSDEKDFKRRLARGDFDESSLDTADDQVKKKGLVTRLRALAKTIYDVRYVDGLRVKSDGTKRMKEERDILLENATLLLRDALTIKHYRWAVKHMDVGRIVHVLEYWMVILQDSTHKNYKYELVHLIICIKFLWGPETLKMWSNNCLVNPSGLKGDGQPCDHFGEHLIDVSKQGITPSTNQHSDHFNDEIRSYQLHAYRMAREAMHETVGTNNYYTKSANTDSIHNARIFSKKLKDNDVFHFTKGRYKPPVDNSEYVAAKDLFVDGSQRLFSGVSLSTYKSSFKNRSTWADPIRATTAMNIQGDLEDT